VDGKQYRAVTNVGVHPTVGGVDKPQAETWIQDFEGELYGQTVCVLLIRFLREERQFDSVEALREQIAADAKAATDALSGADGTKAILFDFDDTLQDRTKAFLHAAHRLLRRHMPSASAAQREEHADTMWRLNDGGYVNYDTYFDRIVSLLPLESGVTAQQLLWEFRRVFPGSSVLFPETPEVLRELERQGYRIGVLTNGNSFQQNRKLDVAGVRLFADLAVVAGDEPIQKPDPQLFRWLAERLCVAPENCVFVGDHPINDIQGALDAGMRAVFLNSRQLDEHPDGVPEIAQLRDLPQVL
jgi:putative hydrolase of the HAD superfamily